MAYRPAIMNKSIADNGKWGKELDYNFFVSNEENMNRYSMNACDNHSINGDPLFIDTAKGDFRVKPNSHVLKLGFKNFSLTDFGVRKPALKAIAKTPQIPEVSITDDFISEKKWSQYTWIGAYLNEPKGEELSAYGMGYDEIGVALTPVSTDVIAIRLGFRNGDLIQSINETKISNIQHLMKYLRENSAIQNHVFVIIRNQAKVKVTVNQTLPMVNVSY